MKYMGSKRSMLRNGLGDLLETLVPAKSGFYDLFCGSASVAGHVAQRFNIPVRAGDLQKYAVILAASQIEQVESFDALEVWKDWMAGSTVWLFNVNKNIEPPPPLPDVRENTREWRAAVAASREYCADLPSSFSLARAYGGYYFSPRQAITIDALRQNLPSGYEVPTLASLIDAASSCTASPGHTAQPFGTKDSALPHLAAAWNKDILNVAAAVLKRISGTKANVQGRAVQGDALVLAESMTEGDLAFIDPPYSEVQYSRFYHVLEAIAQGSIGEVGGVGRYPTLCERPQSLFSRITRSADAFDTLMLSVAASGAEAIVTFPSNEASNGLSGELVEAISNQYFYVKTKKIASLFSTLGGNDINRKARQSTTELVLHLAPR